MDIEDGRRFTLRLRKGHRWSDGHPFTAEDFRYWWQDVANNPSLAPLGPPRSMKVNGEPPVFEIVDEYEVRYTWNAPNPHFLPALAAATPLYIYRPAHYLRRFHAAYAPPGDLAAMVEKSGRRNWAELHNRKDNQYKNDNPALPSLQPWVLHTKPPAQQFLFRRNPYFHRVDQNGRQLPYADRVIMKVASPGVIPLKTGAGDSDLQSRGIAFSNYTFLKEAEKREDFAVRLWRTAKGAHLALFPNLNVNDPVWRRLMRNADFRRALSMAIDRHEINQVIYYGLAVEGQNTVLPESPLHRPEYRDAWAAFDLEAANRLLDRLGLDGRDSRGVRLLPDGRPMEVIVETAGEDTEQADVLELIHDSWLKAGIKLFTRPVPARGVPEPDLRRRNADLHLVRPRERAPGRGHASRRAGADEPASAAMAEMGPALSVRRTGRRETRGLRGDRVAPPEPGMDVRRHAGAARENLASHCSRSMRTGSSPSASSPPCRSRWS